MTIKWKLGVAALAALSLSACATPFQAEVSRFERLPAAQGQSFYVTTQDPKLQGGIEFQAYADLLTAEMAKQGYVPAASPAAADLIVNLDYGVDDGQQRVVSDYQPFGYGYGYAPYYGYGRYRRGWYDPWLYDAGSYRTRSYTFFTSGIDVQIDRAADGTRVFEGKAMARSRTNNLTYLVPNLVTAMFTDFPGNNGETVRITVRDEDAR